MSTGAPSEIVGAVVTGLVAAIGYGVRHSVRKFIGDLKSLVNSRGDNIEGQVEILKTHVQTVDRKVTSTQISVAEIKGRLGMAVLPEKDDFVPASRDRS